MSDKLITDILEGITAGDFTSDEGIKVLKTGARAAVSTCLSRHEQRFHMMGHSRRVCTGRAIGALNVDTAVVSLGAIISLFKGDRKASVEQTAGAEPAMA